MSKLLSVIRHAKSDWGNANLPDFDRPLNKRGLRDAPLMAKYFHQYSGTIDLIISSPANRAFSTAKIFAENCDYPIENIQKDKRIYEASPDVLMEIVGEVSNNINHTVIFGHNPGFSYLVSLLTEEYYSKPTCSISMLDMHIENWNEVNPGIASLKLFDYPKKHAEMQ